MFDTAQRRRGAGFLWLPCLACTAGVILLAGSVLAAKPPAAGGGGGKPKNTPPTCSIDTPATDVTIAIGEAVNYTGTATDSDGSIASYSWSFEGGSPLSSANEDPGNVSYPSAGIFTTSFEATDDQGASCTLQTRTITVTDTPPPPPPQSSAYSVLAANDLGMHCADLDYQIFSILPPFNVMHAQVIQQGTGATAETLPRILNGSEVDIVYSAVSSDLDPKGPGSINTTSDPGFLGFSKTNFWDSVGNEQTLGAQAYRLLYPSTDALGLCDLSLGPCPSALDLFEPIAVDTGIPVPDPVELPGLVVGQQHMPGPANDPQHFDRFDADVPFFVNFPFGFTVTGANWFAADGIPILPIDDNGNDNAYPLMRVQAVTKGSDPTNPDNVLAAVDVVLPVASEADCQGCHADIGDAGNGAASNFASVGFDILLASQAPGTTALNQLQNAAKINILRLHDAKHGANYQSWEPTGAGASLVATACDPVADPNDPDCLANQTPVQCSQCHYSPALDLAQAGPIDEPEQGPRGRQQTHHISQSRAMHGFHGQFTELFPVMPPPNDPLRTADQGIQPINDFELGVLENTCYQCHPGKNTKCLRGAMFQGGMLCQDCHGDMEQVGNDFTADFATNPFPAGADLSKRVSWANEPKCQSCHTGDAVTNLTGDHPDLTAPDGIRLLQAYQTAEHPVDGTKVAEVIQAPDSRFAENQGLYRLSQGHGGVKCEGCHGSTHAIWPVTPREGPMVANDNLAALQLQGHDGKIQECDVCHQRDTDGNLSMPLGLDGPHGMHPVGDNRWNHQHRNFTGGRYANCKGCHGQDLTGTVLSATSADRVLDCKTTAGSFPDCAAGSATAFVPEGTQIGCGNCHKQK